MSGGPQDAFEDSMADKVAVVMNPKSAHGLTGRRWRRLGSLLHEAVGDFTLLETRGPGHAAELVREALRTGHDRIVSVGGDGTHFEVVNGFFEGDRAINAEASLGILSLGTGGDFARSIHVTDPEESIRYLAEKRVLRADVGRLLFSTNEGKDRIVHFLNAVHAGLGGKVGDIANRSSKRLGGFLTFLMAVIQARLTTKSVPMEVTIDDEVFEGDYLDVIATNGQYDGGGMHLAPHARLNDGLFEVYVIGDFSWLETAINLASLYRGSQERHPKVIYRQARKVEVRAKEALHVSPDGEWIGRTPVTMEIVPRALRLVTGPNPPILES